MSAWVEDDSYPSGFRWDPDAPSIAQEPAVTRLPPLPRRIREPEVERVRPRSDLDAAGEPIR